jgi:hypothetical protein
MPDKKSDYNWAVPKELEIPPDKLRARLDFFHQAVELSIFDGEVVTTRVISALDVAHALANDLAFGTGLLPSETLWWLNTRGGPVYAIYVEPKVWRVALELDINTPPRRFNLPMPGLIFLCSPGKAPWVYAVKKKPTKETDDIFNAPLCNIHENGKSCAGTHHYPTRVADIVRSFFTAFFTATANLKRRSTLYPDNVVRLWEYLDGKKKFPVSDLVRIGNIKDLMHIEM